VANPDIPAALVVLQAHLVAAGAALTDDILDVDRGLLATRGRQIRYYWGGEVAPVRMGPEHRVLNGEMVGQRFIIAAAWPLTDLTEANVTAIDVEMQQLAGEVRTRIQGDSTLGGNVTDLDLNYAEPDLIVIAGARHVVLRWDLDLAYIEYTLAQ
jgi:hypothetical protein